ncbi:cytochrome-c peroxidase [Donghicola eburneus]|uniref:Methylamine utilization protein MauG n=1 Tax=Donghicola eburneus TaxID=393278 RepID=A0A1M4N040_9RHOB|nr:cytochrome c peroxidase [Donghicola eburneus]SCM67385.1 Methylamine utilization protein MauG [Donghicola eburneus]SFQ03228.1 Cytochrome c peroxidase [Donghicola eburneus]
MVQIRNGFLACVLSGMAALPVGAAGPLDTVEALGESLFFDTNLSANRTQACATCHDPESGFADPRGMASIGDDGASFGDRNAPTLTYAALTPEFGRNKDGRWHGGQFWEGRAARLEDQAGGPPLNPIEMGMPDKASVVDRLKENESYVAAFGSLYGEGTLDDADAGFAAMTAALAAFERTGQFQTFDSKYDRYLRGDAKLTSEELLGETLFFSQQFTNCNMCHQLNERPGAEGETFTNYQFFNIGVPRNPDLRALNGIGMDVLDAGLGAHPKLKEDGHRGKFKVPTLRNVAVTAPYMHNGVFEDLRTVVLFYNKYNSVSEARQINTETGEPFGPPPVPETLAEVELTEGPALKDREIDAIVAFLKTLTDARYEHLLAD